MREERSEQRNPNLNLSGLLFFFCLPVTYTFSSIKSAAPGAIFPFLKSDEEGLIAQRAARFTFGMNIVVQYDARNPEHSGRPVIDRADGTVVPHGWDQIVAIVSRISDLIYFF